MHPVIYCHVYKHVFRSTLNWRRNIIVDPQVDEARKGALPQAAQGAVPAQRGSTTFWRRRFGADVLAPTFWRRLFWRKDVLAPNRFGANTFWRQDRLSPDFLAPGRFGAKHIIR